MHNLLQFIAIYCKKVKGGRPQEVLTSAYSFSDHKDLNEMSDTILIVFSFLFEYDFFIYYIFLYFFSFFFVLYSVLK